MDYWVIQHPTKGWFVGFDNYGDSLRMRPRYRWSIPASHEETEKTFDPIAAKRLLAKVNKQEKKPCTLHKMST